MRKYAGLCLIGVALLGCQSVSRKVGSELILPDMASRIEVATNQRFLFPGEFEPLVMPAFPDSVAKQESVDLTICVSFTVDEFGETVDIRAENTPQVRCDATADHPAFVDASMRAVDSWEFIAAALCDYDTPELKAQDDDSCDNARNVTAIPVRLAWAFHFKAERGLRSVATSR